MNTRNKSLRSMIEKWVAPQFDNPIHLVRCGRGNSSGVRCVRVETIADAPALTIFFFRHNDGSWNVFPPELERPAMNVFRRVCR